MEFHFFPCLRIVITIVFVFTLQWSFSQTVENALTTNSVSKSTFDSLVRKGFNRIVSGQNDAPSLSNYAAFNPTDGKFSFNGFANINKRFAVTLGASGGLINENIGGLFEGGKVNNNTDVNMKLHLRVDKPKIFFDGRDFETYKIKLAALEREKKIKLAALTGSLNELGYRLNELELRDAFSDSVVIALKKDSAEFFNGKFLKRCDTVKFVSCKKRFADSLFIVIKLLNKEYQEKLKRSSTRDSLTNVKLVDGISKERIKSGTLTDKEKILAGTYGLGFRSLRDSLRNQVDKEYEKKAAKLEYQIPIPRWNASWFTLISNWNRKSYRTYDAELPFASQIQKKEFSTFNFGLEFNNFHFDNLFRNASFLNIGLVKRKNINLGDLTASKVTDTDTASMGSIQRQAITEFNVYTDSIEQYNMWNLYVNFYKVLGKKMSNGVHFGIDTEFRDNDDTVIDGVIGYFFGFNNKSDKRLLNTEVFIRFNDLTDEVDIDDLSFFKQTQIGLSIAIPILTVK